MYPYNHPPIIFLRSICTGINLFWRSLLAVLVHTSWTVVVAASGRETVGLSAVSPFREQRPTDRPTDQPPLVRTNPPLSIRNGKKRQDKSTLCAVRTYCHFLGYSWARGGREAIVQGKGRVDWGEMEYCPIGTHRKNAHRGRRFPPPPLTPSPCSSPAA